ncbi:MAG: M48 family metallopeptidase [Gammaproteobacteria bacterium]|nr:M48 family metallopeptidase [Gammaproteobacteria bacterium]NNF61467.1 M48 family metallopeptidase [Gammaproteobacteria bacterium]
MHPLTTAFLILLLAGTAFRLWLASRQVSAVRAHRDRVPQPFDETISLADHQKAADYSATRVRTGMVSEIIDTALLLGWTLGGGLALLDGLWRDAGLGTLLTGVAVIVSAMIIMAALDLPMSVYRTFGIEARYGFNKTTPRLFVADLVKGLVLMLLLGVPLIAVILWLMERAGEFWWLYTWAVWVGFTLLITWAYPAFIAPLFNKFSPLPNQELAQRIEQLLNRCGFRSKGIFVMDGSRRSTHGNAYFTGVGNNKRIVFFDTLMESLGHEEIEAVLAHELGHFRKRHVLRRLLLSFALSLAGLALLGWLITKPWFFGALGVDTPSNHMALLLFVMVVPVFTFPLTPLMSYLSRRDEFEADVYAAEQSNASALITALCKLYRDNATTLTPDALHSGFYDSHPPATARVARLSELAA